MKELKQVFSKEAFYRRELLRKRFFFIKDGIRFYSYLSYKHWCWDGDANWELLDALVNCSQLVREAKQKRAILFRKFK